MARTFRVQKGRESDWILKVLAVVVVVVAAAAVSTRERARLVNALFCAAQ